MQIQKIQVRIPIYIWQKLMHLKADRKIKTIQDFCVTAIAKGLQDFEDGKWD